MKKFTLIALAIMASATSFAQTILWNGENTEITSKNDNAGFWGDGSPTLADNPQKEGINASEKCIKFSTQNGKTIKLPFREWMTPSMNGSTRVSFMIKKKGAENVVVELSDPTDGSKSYWHRTANWFDGNVNEGWHKLVFDFSSNGTFDKPGVMSITVNDTENVDVYIDNIVIEDAPKVNGELFSDNEITGNVKLTGAWMKGVCSMVVKEGEEDKYTPVTYNDYEFFNGKAGAGLTSVDIRKAQASDVDANMLIKANPNALLYANEDYENVNNVVANGTAKNVVLTDANAFNCPEKFTAEKVTLKRNVRKGINSFVLPFFVGAGDLDATNLAIFTSATEGKVTFTQVKEVKPNIPFITVDLKEAGDNKEFTFFGNSKDFEATPTEFKEAFKGVYTAKDAEGRLYGINDKGELQKGAAGKFIKPFHAYYEAAEGQAAPAKISFEGEATGINSVAATTVANGAVYDLSGRRVAEKLAGASLVKGIYVVNGKKVVVK